MIPLCLVTGFLGSGKTTLLRHLARTRENLVFVVNDFAATDVDGPLVGEAGGRVVSVAGGSIFCTCLVTAFSRVLGDIPARCRPHGVVVEASGVADPGAIRTLLADTGLDRRYGLRAVWGVVDPGTLPKLLRTLPAIRRQVAAADRVILNKIDRFPAEAIEAAAAAIEGVHPGVPVTRTAFGAVGLDPFAGEAAGRDRPGRAYATCRDPDYETLRLRGDRTTVADLKRLVVERGPALYRIKGTLVEDGRAWYVDYAGAGLEIRPAGPGFPSEVVVILRRGATTLTGSDPGDRREG